MEKEGKERTIWVIIVYVCFWASYTLEFASSTEIKKLGFLGIPFHEPTVRCEVKSLFKNHL